jgi:AcrR family transcriptional regulator
MKVGDVTKEAGVAMGLFYHYFSDLRSLTEEVLEDFLDSFEQLEEIEKDVPKGDWYLRMYAHNKFVVDYYTQHAGLMRCLFQFADENQEFKELYRQSTLRQLHWLADLLPQLFPDAGLNEDESLMIVYGLAGSGVSLLREYYIDQNPALRTSKLTGEEMAELITVILYRGLFLENPPAEHLKYAGKLSHMKGIHRLMVSSH